LISESEVYPSLEGDYKMIESLEIKNFRCFESVRLDDLRRINVIVGKNASGKTALLEAIFLGGGGNPEVAMRLHSWRLLSETIPLTDPTGFESLWRDLFYGFDLTRVIEVALKGTPQHTQAFRIIYTPIEDSLFIPFNPKEGEAVAALPISFETIDNEGQKFVTPIKLTEKGLSMRIKPTPIKAAYFASSLRPPPKEGADRFSALSKLNRERRVVETLRRVYDFIEDLTVETSGDGYMIYARINSLSEKVPVSLISEGVYKLMSILLGIAFNKGGIVMLDEVENGFYYETLPEIWQLLFEFCEEFKTQLFVTTHSLEAIKNILPTMNKDESNEKKFSLIRTEVSEGQCTLRQFSGAAFKRAIEQRIELR
jgi:hypothetical protein